MYFTILHSSSPLHCGDNGGGLDTELIGTLSHKEEESFLNFVFSFKQKIYFSAWKQSCKKKKSIITLFTKIYDYGPSFSQDLI